ncbi:hypothetical protein SPI_06008 [Niveomyces insectorum RCEF 264]|uniref:Uncharacterized protein n=1 Tax=Niveomyces insectorum RCEF 264 TaxID=1081102 RepID=A0A167SPF9_9HYPO|nr:hypothetical protein SPI_06008 [Niveomyces insectorum RCEF 264]
MPVPVAVYTTFPQAAEGLTKGLQPEYEVVHVSKTKEEALADLPGVFSKAGGPKALIIAGPPDDDEAAIAAAAQSGSASARIVRLTRDDFESAGIKLPPPGTPIGPPPPGAPRPDPEVFNKLYKEKLAGL